MKTSSLVSSVLATIICTRVSWALPEPRTKTGQRNTRINGGEPAAKGEFPSFAAVVDGGCGGTLVYHDIVLTAAHCIPAFQEGQLIAIGGTKLDGSDATDVIPVSESLQHPGNYLLVGSLWPLRPSCLSLSVGSFP